MTAVDIDFPSGTATWTQSGATAVTGATTYQTYSPKDAVSIVSEKEVTNLTKFETSVFTGTTAVLTSEGAVIQDATNEDNKGKIFIVTPVATTGDKGLEHVFGVKVTYNVQYKKKQGNEYVNDGEPEVGCIATGVIGGGNAAATQYKPTQNSSYVVTIDVNPEQIQFCVDEVKAWDNDTAREVEVK